jgi:hypothetical protein
MPHQLEKFRDDYDALIGPIEELIFKFDQLPQALRLSFPGVYYKGGLEQAIEAAQNIVAEIDEFEEPEPEDDEPDAGTDDAVDDDDEDEEA